MQDNIVIPASLSPGHSHGPGECSAGDEEKPAPGLTFYLFADEGLGIGGLVSSDWRSVDC
jgi:hypothetical protein